LSELIILAGPNGSGKSTLTKSNLFDCPVVDPDTAFIYDNSTDEGHRLIATIEQNIITMQTTECPQWFKKAMNL
jgi:predicted ABC-type ATPase